MSPSSGEIRVLHVDDEPGLADLSAEYLERRSERLAVETRTSASEGLDRLRDGVIHCVVSDFDMPGQDGIEFLEAVREDHPDLPFILYTGKGSEEVASEAIRAGVSDYLQKESGTSHYEVLANRIQNVVEQHRSRVAVAETEQRLRTIAENTNDILWKFTADWNELLFINSAYEDIWGQSIAELRERPQSFLDGIHPDDREHVETAMRRLSSGDSVDIEYRVNADENFGRWVWVQGEPVFDDDGDVAKVVGFARDVTDRKERERELQEKQADHRLYKRAFEGATDLLGAADTEYTLLFANERYREYHGLSPDDVGRITLPEYIGEAWETAVKPRLDRTLEGEALRYEMEREGPDGDDRFLDIRYYPLTDEDGTVQGAVSAMRDVTEWKNRGQILEQLKRNVTDVVWMTGPEKESMDFISDSYEDVWGRSVASLHEDPLAFVDDVHPEDRDRVRAALEDQQQHPDDYEEVYRIARPDGEQRWIHDRSSGVYEDGELTRIIGIASDITETREYQRKLGGLHDVAVDLATSDSVEAICERTVEASEELLDFDVSGVDLAEQGYLHKIATSAKTSPEGTTTMSIDEGLAGQTYRTGESFLVGDLAEHEEARPQGSYRSAISLPISDHGVFQAVDERPDAFDADDLEIAELLVTHTTQALDRLRREQTLRRQNERLDEFTRVVSHDLRNPLNVAQGSLELGQDDCDSEDHDTVALALERMEVLIDDLLTLAREGETAGSLDAVALAEIGQRCWANVETGNATLRIESENVIEADTSRLRQLLENLIRNAVEHGSTSPPSPTRGDAGEHVDAAVTVTIGDLEDGFYVADDGPGIPEGDREHVFEAGYTTAAEGTGFGLAIVEQIADAHQWTCRVTEGPDGGARFEFTGVQVA